MEHRATSFCVTGATGFIGTVLCEHMVKLGLPVIAVGHHKRPLINGADCLTWDDFLVMPVRPALTTIHLAGPNNIEQLEKLGSQIIDQQIDQQSEIAKIIAAKSSKVIFASSASVYPKNIKRPLVESDQASPDSVYALMKLQIEQIVLDSGGAVIRLSNCYGHGSSSNTILMSLMRGLLGEDDFVRVRSSADERDYLYVEDAVEGFILAARNPEIKGVFNFGTGIATSVEALFHAMCQVTGLNKKLISENLTLGTNLVLNSERAKREFGWHATTSLLDGLHKTLQGTDNMKREL